MVCFQGTITTTPGIFREVVTVGVGTLPGKKKKKQDFMA